MTYTAESPRSSVDENHFTICFQSRVLWVDGWVDISFHALRELKWGSEGIRVHVGLVFFAVIFVNNLFCSWQWLAIVYVL